MNNEKMTNGISEQISNLNGGDLHSKESTSTEREKSKYPFIRAVNQLINAYYFTLSNDPYSPHIVFDKYGQLKLIAGDHTFSLIDLKNTSLAKTLKFAREKFDAIRGVDPTFFQDILGIEQGKDTNGAIILSIKELVYQYANDQQTDLNSQGRVCESRYPVTKRLYEIMPKVGDIFEVVEGEKKQISLSENGRKYITSILCEFFTKYEKDLTLGRNWKEIVFPNGIFTYHLSKIVNNQSLSEKEINDFMAYLYSNPSKKDQAFILDYIIGHTSVTDKSIAKDMSKGYKSLISNHTYAGMYVEQGYHYALIKHLTKQRYDSIRGGNGGMMFTEGGSKGLPSMSDKELRSEIVGDFTRARTWVDSELLQDKSKRSIEISRIFTDKISLLKESYDNQGWEMNITKVDIVNKYKKGSIIIGDDEVAFIKNDLNKSLVQKTPQSTQGKHEISQKQGIPKITIDRSYCVDELGASQEEIDGIQRSFEKDISKTGGNGDYADIKVKLQYTLTNKKTGETVHNTGGYEHQIVNFDSTNEAGLSSHSLILDPRKNIVNQIRDKGQLNVEEFGNIVSGGLKALLTELCEWEDVLGSNKYEWSYYKPRSFVETQFNIRNSIPRELCEIAGFESGTTYTSIANDSQKKMLLEKAVERYILRDLFTKQIIHPYIYINDSDGSQHEILSQQKIELQQSNYRQKFDIDEYLDKLLNSDLKQRNLYRICGGGSGNLTKTILNATLSEKGYIGIIYKGGIGDSYITFIKVGKMANILYHSISYSDSDKKITTKDFQNVLYDILSK